MTSKENMADNVDLSTLEEAVIKDTQMFVNSKLNEITMLVNTAKLQAHEAEIRARYANEFAKKAVSEAHGAHGVSETLCKTARVVAELALGFSNDLNKCMETLSSASTDHVDADYWWDPSENAVKGDIRNNPIPSDESTKQKPINEPDHNEIDDSSAPSETEAYINLDLPGQIESFLSIHSEDMAGRLDGADDDCAANDNDSDESPNSSDSDPVDVSVGTNEPQVSDVERNPVLVQTESDVNSDDKLNLDDADDDVKPVANFDDLEI